MAGPDTAFWQDCYRRQATGWDRGGASPQLIAWLDSGLLEPCRIAVPGCGSGWEVAELARRGFEVTGIDYTPEAVERSAARCQAQGLRAELVQADVLSYRPAQPFDAVYEQTCLCALHPQHWRGYSAQLAHWLRPAGTLWALFMQVLRPAAAEQGLIQGPPYHCDITAMRSLFTEPDWAWPAPPYARVPHPNRAHELAVPLKRH